MPWKFNPFTGSLDYYETGAGGSAFDPDVIVTAEDSSVSVSNSGNVITKEF